MFRPNVLAGAAIAVAVLAPPALFAADILEPVIMEPQPLPVELGSNWYLRGDVAYKHSDEPQIKRGSGLSDEKIEAAMGIGVGVGYKVNDWFRTDVTFGYDFPADIEGRRDFPSRRSTRDSGEISAVTGLWNAYFDIGDWHGFSPYVGVGLGGANVAVENYRFRNPDERTTKVGAHDEWNMAYAFMAGVGYALSPEVMVEAGYRYISMGDVKTKAVNGTSVSIDDLSAHEVRLGVRFLID